MIGYFFYYFKDFYNFIFFLAHLVRIDMKISKSLQNICFIEIFLAPLMEKKQKLKVNLKMGKISKKEEDICFR